MDFIQPKKTVLIIEANGHSKRDLLKTLARKGCFILTAVDLDQAYRIISGPVDIVILDGEFPGVDADTVKSKLLLANPSARLLINTTQPEKFKTMDGVEVFEKPREAKALEEALHDCN